MKHLDTAQGVLEWALSLASNPDYANPEDMAEVADYLAACVRLSIENDGLRSQLAILKDLIDIMTGARGDHGLD